MFTDTIIEDYQNFVSELENTDLFEACESFVFPAMEADTDSNGNSSNNEKPINPKPESPNASNTNDNTDSSANMNKKAEDLGEFIRNIFSSLIERIRRMGSKFTMMIEDIVDGTKKFREDYDNARRNYKPKNDVYLTYYEYDDNALSNVRSKFKAFVNKMFGLFLNGTTVGRKQPDNTIFEVPESQFDSLVFQSIGAGIPTQITTFDKFKNFIQSRFRRKTVSRHVTPNYAANFEKAAFEDGKIIRSILKKDQADAYTATTRIVNSLKNVKNNRMLTNETRDRAKKYGGRITRLEKMYNSFLEFYYRMRMERVLSSRTILKKIYGL